MPVPALEFTPPRAEPPGSFKPEFGRTGPSLAAHRTVMVVDDDPQSRQVTVRILRDAGYTVIEAGSGQEALALLNATGHIELVLTDVAMPEMDGLELAGTIHAIDPSQRVVLISGYASTITKLGLMGSPLPLIPKPIAASQLVQKVDEFIRKPLAED